LTLVKNNINASGYTLTWGKTYGGSQAESNSLITFFDSSSVYLISNTLSNDYEVSGNHGGADL
jgi:hypothetical protein